MFHTEYTWQVIFDCDANALAAVAKWVENQPKESDKVLLIKTPFSKLETEPWRELLGAVIENQKIGHYVELIEAHKILKGVKNISLLDVDILSEEGNFNIDINKKTPSDEKEINSLQNFLLAWGKIEIKARVNYRVRFSSLCGGMRPLVVVLDDYNNYIKLEKGVFAVNESSSIEDAAKDYFGEGENAHAEFKKCLIGYCRTLNNLSIGFNVHCPKLWPKKAGYEDVIISLNSEWLEQRRERIAAFLVDLEWKRNFSGEKQTGADELWDSMGQRAIHLLSRKFPEIPCFVFAGSHPYNKLQDALSYGAYWCFTKAKSHHSYEIKDEEPLTALALEDHLTNVTSVKYGAFPDLPFPEQMKINPLLAPARKLASKLGFHFPIERYAVGRDLQRIIARMYPDGAEVWPLRVLDTGLSKAKAQFFIAADRKGQQLATRFVKVGPWIEIQREYLAYKSVVEPRLNSYIASVVGEPVVSVSSNNNMPIAGIVYSLAGFPEDYENLRSLDDILNSTENETTRVKVISRSIQRTLEHVLKPLYTRANYQQSVKLKPIEKPLWCWLGDVLPPIYTGVLPPMGWDGESSDESELFSYLDRDYKESTAWILDARNCSDLPRNDTLSPWCLGEKSIKLQGFQFLEVEWDSGDQGMGEITLRHPSLGFRVRLRGRANDIQCRFGGIWMRPGMPVNVTAMLDIDNRELAKITASIQTGLDAFDKQKKIFDQIISDPRDPRIVFSGKGIIPFHYTITACQSSIHGDLNPCNILLTEEGATGWLIDFERAVEQGMTAFDLAKLEVEIWHHHLLPALESIYTGLLETNKKYLELHIAALAAMDAGVESSEIFEANVREVVIAQAPVQLLNNAKQYLEYIETIRNFAREILGPAQDELWWALSAYFFVSCKFVKKYPERAALMFVASAWYLSKVCPTIPKDYLADMKEIERKTSQSCIDQIPKRLLDGLLLGAQKEASKYTMKLTEVMAGDEEKQQVRWPLDKSKERWDLASTGGVANITPIIGYLWLMVKARQSKKGTSFKVVVPKISSPGQSCGTVDIFESVGLAFPEESYAIVDACKTNGGVLCRQNPQLTPMDTILMARRKKTNLMKDIGLTLSSILSKKITMGCTHVIIDVKVGCDSKILAPWMKHDDIKDFVSNVPSGVMFPNVAEKYKNLLEKELKLDSKEMNVKKENGFEWLKHIPKWSNPRGNSAALKEIRWFFTNSAMPQCRAIGRHLILIHVDQLLNEINNENLLFDQGVVQNTEYGKLYGNVLPTLCGVELVKDKKQNANAIRAQWEKLKQKLPLWRQLPAHEVFDKKNPKYVTFHGSAEKTLDELEIEISKDLSLISIPAYPYISGAKQSVKIEHINVYELDKLFDRLCGDTKYDAEVGIWLHTLPGEKIGDPKKTPVISIFFHPSVTPQEEVLQRARYILSEHVVIKDK